VSRTDRERLNDILERVDAIGHAEELLIAAESNGDGKLTRTAFDAILYDLLVIGEAVKTLPTALIERHPEIPWADIAKLRDLLAHIYFKVRSEVIRSTINAPLSELREACETEVLRLVD
jgi:uncharacterized protein with HEPN domain